MSNKRKLSQDEVNPKRDDDSSNEDSDDSLKEIVDVDFDFFNPDEIDYHALKRLLGQLFSSDAELMEVGDIVDILLEENHVGTTVKVDGQESDPYAILSVINLQQQKDNKGIQSLCSYLLNKCPKKYQKLHTTVRDLLSPDAEKSVGWVVSERFINMPVEIMVPMYTMLRQEIAQAVENKEPYQFEWFMFISKVYKEVAPTADEDDNDEEEAPAPAQKKARKGKKAAKATSTAAETFYFQAEDEIVAKYAEYQFDYRFTNSDKEAASDSKRAFSDFGIAPSRRLFFVHQSKFADLVNEIDTTCSTVNNPTASK
ncbi:p21-C-terminal region-binding protein-domain-containing protein [Radiomyces spectabilis]|uniref:p21-C-terminal region-binding protein-domain-containing protein n=1 Tax=Radiomyces spectabilis TaxID=64574 RepID=UPI002220C2D6|nr:p21-C-terminal region-binding protein-domain-containing protein [Radiomyces spectabilis]KAI8372784.1 p21-C-terminal region-binding protein-domain-containing protein [Radiomyces spectabilis]